MKLGLVADGLGPLKLSDCLDRVAALGLQTVEFGTGCWSEAPHLDLRLLRSNPEARARLLAEVSARGLEISALNCSGNPLHPGPTGTMHRQITRDQTFAARKQHESHHRPAANQCRDPE